MSSFLCASEESSNVRVRKHYVKQEARLRLRLIVANLVFVSCIVVFLGLLETSSDLFRAMTMSACCVFAAFMFHSNIQKEDCLSSKEAEGKRKKGDSCGCATNFMLMMDLRKKIMAFRDIIDLPPCTNYATIDELVIRTIQDLHKFFPDDVTTALQTSEMKEKSTDQVMIAFYDALSSLQDSWMRNYNRTEIIKNDMEELNSEQIVEAVLTIVDQIINVAKERFDVMYDDSHKIFQSPRAYNAFGKNFMDPYSDTNSPVLGSPVTPTSVLDFMQAGDNINTKTKANIVASNNYIPLALPLKVRGIKKLSAVDIRRLYYDMIPPVEQINKICEGLDPKDMSESIKEVTNEEITRDYDKHKIENNVRDSENEKEPETALKLHLVPKLSPQNVEEAALPPPLPLKSTATSPSPAPIKSTATPPPPPPPIKSTATPPPPPPSQPIKSTATSPPPPPPIKLTATPPPPSPLKSTTTPPPPPPPSPQKSTTSPPPPPPQKSTANPPPPPPSPQKSTVTPPPPPPPSPVKNGNGSLPAGGSPPPPPPGGGRSLRAKKASSKLKRSTQLGNLYRILKGKIEGSSFKSKSSNGRKPIGSPTAAVGKQGMADALAEITKRSSYFQQIEEDVQNYAQTINELRKTIATFETSDMKQLITFHKHLESHLEKLTDETQVLARFEGFPSKKLEAIRTASSLYSKLDAIHNDLKSWRIEPPLGQLLDKVERYFTKVKEELDAFERIKDEEAKKFQSQNITFDFQILTRIKESMVDVSSSCMELALKERREMKNAEAGDKPKQGCPKMLWRAFQFAFRVYTFSGGLDDRADELTKELAQEIERTPQN